MALAKAFATSAPELDDRRWRIDFEFEGHNFSLWLHGDVGELSRPLHVAHEATVHTVKYIGRDQENYGPRPLLEADDGKLRGPAATPLRGWEQRLPKDILGQMKTLGLAWLAFDRGRIRTGSGELDEPRVRDLCRLLNAVSSQVGEKSSI